MNVEGFKFTAPSKQMLMEGLAVAIQQRAVRYPPGPIVAELEAFEYVYTRTGVHYCLAPDTPVLTADLYWRPVGKLVVGDRLLAFEEWPPQGKGKRRWQPATVLATERVQQPCYRLTMAAGPPIVASAEHRWLVDGPDGMYWRRTADLQARHPRSRSPRDAPTRLLRLLPVWPTDTTYGAGYLAAAFDGEGCLVQPAKANGGYSCRVVYAQRDNAMAQEVRVCLAARGFTWAEARSNASVLSFGLTGRRPQVLRFLGQVRPRRLLQALDLTRLGSVYVDARIAVERVESLGAQPVIALATSTGTIVAGGYASHNSAPEGLHDDCVCALALAVHQARTPGWGFF